ncbi:MAG TPA: hypothetical protein VIU45_09035 [Chitinophagaceae bacterium]
MSTRILLGIILLVAGIFQTVTVFLLYKGHQHYMLKLMKRPFAMVFYAIFAGIMYFIGIKFLLK